MNKIMSLMAIVGTVAPVTWDRYTYDNVSYYVVYGWINRPDGTRDFVLLAQDELAPAQEAFYTTSSAKYSQAIATAIYGTSADHNPCRKVEELYARNEGPG